MLQMTNFFRGFTSFAVAYHYWAISRNETNDHDVEVYNRGLFFVLNYEHGRMNEMCQIKQAYK